MRDSTVGTLIAAMLALWLVFGALAACRPTPEKAPASPVPSVRTLQTGREPAPGASRE